MKNKTIIIAGAGASGLMAARELCKAGYHVTMLEGRDRIGGRIHSIDDPSFPQVVELGAEFIHGRLPLTLSLLKEYNIKKIPAGGKFITITNGEYEKSNDVVTDYHGELEDHLEKQEEDITVTAFLEKYFREPRYQLLRESAIKFTEGFDTADPSKSSILAFKKEWLESDEHQYRIEGGYRKLINALKEDCPATNFNLHLNTIIKEIKWSKDAVDVITDSNETVSAEKIIITFPLGIWTAANGKAAFTLQPEIPQLREAAIHSGYGNLIKIIFCFDELFWKKDSVKQWTGSKMDETGFLFSKEKIPTWWTQYPQEIPVLTGWLGGPKSLSYTDEKIIYAAAVESLKNIFGELPPVKGFHIVNWNTDPFSNGSYSYETVNAKKYLAVLNTPVENTIYLAGEALFDGEGLATVEAALQSGKATVEKIIQSAD